MFSNDEKIRMDASIMACSIPFDNDISHARNEEKEMNATSSATNKNIEGPHRIVQKRRYPRTPQPTYGAIAGVEHVKNPVSLARAVMDHTPHVMLIGKGAEEFVNSLQLVETRPDEYFWTERRWK